MTQLDTRPAQSPRMPAPEGKRRLGARRSVLLTLEDTVEMVGAPDRPAWLSVHAKGSRADAGPATIQLAWHLDQDQDNVRMTLREGRAFAAALLATCNELEVLGKAQATATGHGVEMWHLRSIED